MLPPVLEVFIVWHPDDEAGSELASKISDHFMLGSTFSGVIGGGVVVSLRSSAWGEAGGAPRPIFSINEMPPNGIQPAKFVAVVPLLGTELAARVEDKTSGWHDFIKGIRSEQSRDPARFGVYPYLLSQGAIDQTELGALMGAYQLIAAGTPDEEEEDVHSMTLRDLSQGIVQLISPDEIDRLTAFISHTKRNSTVEGEDVEDLIGLVREAIGATRLNDFFDANDLQPGTDWDAVLREQSARSAMLALRTDLYASREWCQREVAIAKTHGMPVVMIDALGRGEERGSFLMDHVPKVAVRKPDGRWAKSDVYRALNLLVDECLKRALWMRQRELARECLELDVAWWAPHAPEPLTLSHWISEYLAQERDGDNKEDIRILHPDPPLGPEELAALEILVGNTRVGRSIDVMTPRQLATRGG